MTAALSRKTEVETLMPVHGSGKSTPVGTPSLCERPEDKAMISRPPTAEGSVAPICNHVLLNVRS